MTARAGPARVLLALPPGWRSWQDGRWNVVLEQRAGNRWKVRRHWSGLRGALGALLRGAVLGLTVVRPPHDPEALLGALDALESRVLAPLAERGTPWGGDPQGAACADRPDLARTLPPVSHTEPCARMAAGTAPWRVASAGVRASRQEECR